VFTDLFNTFPGPSSVPGFVYFCLTSEPKAPWAWNVLSPQHVPISAASKKRLPINWRLWITLASLETGACHITKGRFTISGNCVGSDTCALMDRPRAVLYAVVATRTGNLRAWYPGRTRKIGGKDLTLTGVTAKISNEISGFSKLDARNLQLLRD
jgi:hypothetical protein